MAKIKYIPAITILLISILLYGCGEGNHGYGWDYDYKYKEMRVRGKGQITKEGMYKEYQKAVQCFGEKPPPFIIYTPDFSTCGRSITNPSLILINNNCKGQQEAIRHELVHYFGVKKHKQDFYTALNCINYSYDEK